MRNFGISFIVMLPVLLSGCQQGLPSSRLSADTLEYTRTYEREGVRILLTGDGGARVDLGVCLEGQWQNHAFVLPAVPNEVRRLAKVVGSLAAASAATPLNQWEMQFAKSKSITFVSVVDGVRREVRMGAGQESTDLVWRGVIDEVRVVALYELAEAINHREQALAAAKEGNLNSLLEQTNSAIRSFCRWAEAREHRYGDGIFEPQLAEIILGGYTILVMPNALAEVPASERTLKAATELVSRSWRELTENDFIISRESGLTTVCLSKRLVDMERSNLPVRPSPAAMATLRTPPEWGIKGARGSPK
jgi:hypothetical protein